MVVLVMMYLGISLVALSAIPPQKLGTTYIQDPIAGIVAYLPFGGTVLGPWIGLLAAVILFVASNAGLVGASRLSFNMGEYYQLPKFFYRIHSKFRTPYVALAFFGVVAVLVILWSEGKMMFLADLYNFGAMIAFFSAHLSLIVMRIKKPHLNRPFRVPFNIKFGKYSIPVTAIIGALATMSVWFLVVITKKEGRNLGLCWMAIGILMYLAYRRKQRMTATGQLSIERIKIPEYKPILLKRILVPTRGGIQTETVQVACELAKLHGAKVSALHILQVPPSMPLDADLSHRVLIAELTLKRAEAIAREFNIEIDVQLVRSRSVADTVLETLKESKYDLLVLGAMKSSKESHTKGLGPVTERILKEAPCRVWVCCTDAISREGRKEGLLLGRLNGSV
jgi:APA family basic amino acid/polyamine antiporter